MMEITIEATKEELGQMAKMAYIGQYVADSSGQFSSGYQYPNIELLHDALRQLNKALYQAIPGSGLLEVDGNNRKVFTHTMLMEDTCRPMIEEFNDADFLNRVCTQLSNRDFEEQCGTPDDAYLVPNAAYEAIYNNNMEALKNDGLKLLRLMDN